MWIDQRLAAANGYHWRVTLLRRPQAVLQAHHVLERRGIFPNSAATCACQITGVQRLELKNGRELLRATQLMPNNVAAILAVSGNGNLMGARIVTREASVSTTRCKRSVR